MKLIIVAALALVAVVAARPSEVAKEVKIVRAEFVQQPDGGYVKNTETEDGFIQTEVGELKEVLDEENKPHLVVVVRGEYSYTDPEGNKQAITYSADEGGFHADGPSIPKNAER